MIKTMKKKFKRTCHCGKNKKCKLCNGKGIYVDYIYYHIINGVAYESDTLA